MLHQNWFQDKKFEMFYENPEAQWFLDTTNKVIYVVEERCNGNIVIEEHSGNETDYAYARLLQEYEKWKRDQEQVYVITACADVDITIKAHSKEEAEDIYLKKYAGDRELPRDVAYFYMYNEITSVKDEDGNEI